MPFYRKLGTVPPKRHIKHVRKKNSHLDEGIYYEHVLTTGRQHVLVVNAFVQVAILFSNVFDVAFWWNRAKFSIERHR